MAAEFNWLFNLCSQELSQQEAIPCEVDVNSLISEQGILSLLLPGDIEKSHGPDGSPTAFFNRYAEWVAIHQNCIYSRSAKDAALPDDLLIARVTLVKKAGKATQFITTSHSPDVHVL